MVSIVGEGRHPSEIHEKHHPKTQHPALHSGELTKQEED